MKTAGACSFNLKVISKSPVAFIFGKMDFCDKPAIVKNSLCAGVLADTVLVDFILFHIHFHLQPIPLIPLIFFSLPPSGEEEKHQQEEEK